MIFTIGILSLSVQFEYDQSSAEAVTLGNSGAGFRVDQSGSSFRIDSARKNE